MKKGEKTRIRLLECAAKIIARYGSGQLTVRLLAEHAGVSPGLINRYFPKAEEIYTEVVSYIFSRYYVEIPPTLIQARGEARLIASAQYGLQHYVFDNFHYNLCLTHAYVHARGNKTVGAILHQMVWGSVDRVKGHVRDMLDDHGLVATEKQIALFGFMYMQLLEGGLQHCTLLKTKKERRDYADQFVEVLQERIDEFLFRLENKK